MSPSEVDAAVDRLEVAWDDYDRAGDPLVQVRHPCYIEKTEDTESRAGTSGSPAVVIEQLEAYTAAGMTHFILQSPAATLSDELEQIERFADTVMPAFQ
jgi:alkanesulfonate monooxygenase SsuD/methylene tetrahydromethanopterin reductase-like flavin-dependent oxidoreductase (luciferase family)